MLFSLKLNSRVPFRLRVFYLKPLNFFKQKAVFFLLLFLFGLVLNPIFLWAQIQIKEEGEEKGTAKQEEKRDASPEYVQEYINKAVVSYREKKYDESLEYIRHVIVSDFKNPALRYLAAHSHWRNKEYASAEVHFKVFINEQPNTVAGYTGLALLYCEKGNYWAANRLLRNKIRGLKRAGQEIPVKFFNILARSSFYRANYKKMMEHISAAKSRFSQENQKPPYSKIETLLLEARMYFLTKKFDKAEVSALWASELIPNNVYSLNLLGVIYLTWAEKTSEEKRKSFLYQSAKESLEKALYNVDESSPLHKTIKENLTKIPL